MTYKISIDKKAQKFILKQPKNIQNFIYKAIYHLPSGDTRPLEGHNGELIICVVDAGNRGDIYKRY